MKSEAFRSMVTGEMIADHAGPDALQDDQEIYAEQIEEAGIPISDQVEFKHTADETEMFWFQDTESEQEEEDDSEHATHEPKAEKGRVPALEKTKEYLDLKALGLSVRPTGCSLGIHPGARVWRASTSTSSHFSRSFGESSGRTSWQALLRVMELMLDSYVSENSNEHELKLVKHQLARIRKLRKQEPTHKD